MAVWRALYTLPWVLAIAVLMSPLGNASCFVKEFQCTSNGLYSWFHNRPGCLLVALNGPDILVSGVGTSWAFLLEVGLVVSYYLVRGQLRQSHHI